MAVAVQRDAVAGGDDLAASAGSAPHLLADEEERGARAGRRSVSSTAGRAFGDAGRRRTSARPRRAPPAARRGDPERSAQ